MFEQIVSVATLVLCVWILVNIGCKFPDKIRKVNKRIKGGIRSFIKGMLDD